ncbi:MAG TPA: NADP-dependent oxidoreductase [Acidimicrobiales bacterium]
MPKAVRFDHYGDVDVLEVVDVPRPQPGPNELLIGVKAAGINPGEAKIREGLLAEQFPATFPSGQGSDLAGVVDETGSGVTGWVPGDEIIGFTDRRASQAEVVVVEASDVVAKPPNVSWEVAGSLFVAGTTAYAAVRAVAPRSGDTVLVAGATGGVGSIAVQLARRTGATVVGVASESHHEWLTEHRVIPVAYGDGLEERLRGTVEGIDACIDTVGGEYVELALALGVAPSRIDTIANFDAVQRFGVKAEGNAAGGNSTVLGEVVSLLAEGALEVPIEASYPLDQVRDAYRRLARGHVLGKIVLLV